MSKPFFKFSQEEAKKSDFGVLPEGKYECIIESGKTRKASTGLPGIEFTLKVRDDVEGQSYGGRKLWYRLWFSENTEGIVHGFLNAINAPDGKEFASEEEMINYAVGKAVIANVKVKQYKGKDQNEVNYLNESEVGGGRVDSPFDDATGREDPFAQDGETIEISDDDLPF